MDCKRKPGIRSRMRWFRGVALGLGVCIVGVLPLILGCSGGEDNAPKGKNKVVVAIEKPVPEPAPKKEVEPSPVAPQKPAESAAAPEKETPPEQESAGQQAPSAPEAAGPTKAAPVAVQAEAPPPKKPEALKVEKPEAPKAEKPEVPKVEEGFVRVKKGESLSAVADRKDVYGDPLKWPLLYRLNSGHLAMIRTEEDVEKKPLPKGMSLRYVPPAEEKGAKSPPQEKPWVITILSWQTRGRLAAPAIKLLENGYRAYITRAVVNGKHWLRLRVGFYGSKAEALAARKKIQDLLGKDDSWVARAGKSELEEFGTN